MKPDQIFQQAVYLIYASIANNDSEQLKKVPLYAFLT